MPPQVRVHDTASACPKGFADNDRKNRHGKREHPAPVRQFRGRCFHIIVHGSGTLDRDGSTGLRGANNVKNFRCPTMTGVYDLLGEVTLVNLQNIQMDSMTITKSSS